MTFGTERIPVPSGMGEHLVRHLKSPGDFLSAPQHVDLKDGMKDLEMFASLAVTR